jgi:hypothetical protein
MLSRRTAMRTHQEIDARSLAMHRLVAEKLRRDPCLLDRANRTLARWRATASPSSQPYLEEWERILRGGLDATIAVLLDDSERATALRQCSPFAGVLSSRERFSFLREWKAAHAA